MEKHEQARVVAWARLQKEIGKLLIHIPNGGSRHILEAVNLRKAGTVSGVFDLFLAIAKRGFHGLWIEMKFGKGKLSENQEEWLIAVKAQGYAAVVCDTADAAINEIKAYMGWA